MTEKTQTELFTEAIDLAGQFSSEFKGQVDLNKQSRDENSAKVNAEIKRIGADGRYQQLFVDQIKGADSSESYNKKDGMPLKTLSKAFSLVPRNSSATVYLWGDYDFLGEARASVIESYISVTPANYHFDENRTPVRIKLNTRIDKNNNINMDAFYYSQSPNGGSLKFIGIGFDFPETVPEGIQHRALSSIYASWYWHNGSPMMKLGFIHCDFNMPEDGYGYVLGVGSKTGTLVVNNCTYTTAMAGHWLSDGAHAGALSKDIHNVVTNLETL